MTTPTNLYDIRIYDHDLLLYLSTVQWNRLEFTQRINAPWNHFFELRTGIDDPIVNTIRNIKKDYIIEIYRYDPFSGERFLVYEGFHNTLVDQITSTGILIFSFYGDGFTTLLNRRIVLPPAGESHNTRSGPAETVAKGFVEDCLITSEASRRIPTLSISPDLGRGNQVEYKARYTQLHSVLETVCEGGGLDFGITSNGEKGTFLFDARPLWGKDRTINNTEGNLPVLLSAELGNMQIPILSTNASEEKNYIYVGGAGQEESRIVTEVYDVAAISSSPYGRKELFIDARQEESKDSLIARGLATLNERKTAVKFTFNIEQIPSSRWLVHWNLGDLITAQYGSQRFNKKITKITVSVTGSDASAGGAENIDVEIEDA